MAPSTPLLARGFLFLFLSFAALSPAVRAQDDLETVRVRLMRDYAPRTILVSSNRPLTLYAGDPNNPIDQLAPREKLTITTSNNQVYLRLRDGAIFARSLIMTQEEDAELTLEIAEGHSIPPSRTYKGAFVIQVDPATPSTLNIENAVGMEDYVTAVLASEFDLRELEAAKAVAVCIRTLAYRALVNQNGPQFAVPDDEMWQVYAGTGPINRTVLEAVQTTRGEVLKYEGNLAEATYFASSGGHTANNEDVWNATEAVPYLRGKPDPYDRNSPHHNWESTISRDRLLSTLSKRFGFKVSDLRPIDRSRDGRVRTLALSGNGRRENITGNDFRMLIAQNFGRDALKSTLFEVNDQPDLYIFSGKGYGHGVGLNQWGALELARKGNLYEEILGYYYNGVQLEKGGILNTLIADGAGIAYDDQTIVSFADDEAYAAYAAPATTSRSNDISARLFGDDDGAPVDDIETTRERRRPTREDEPAVQQSIGSDGAPLNWNSRSEGAAAKAAKPTKKRIGW